MAAIGEVLPRCAGGGGGTIVCSAAAEGGSQSHRGRSRDKRTCASGAGELKTRGRGGAPGGPLAGGGYGLFNPHPAPPTGGGRLEPAGAGGRGRFGFGGCAKGLRLRGRFSPGPVHFVQRGQWEKPGLSVTFWADLDWGLGKSVGVGGAGQWPTPSVWRWRIIWRGQ